MGLWTKCGVTDETVRIGRNPNSISVLVQHFSNDFTLGSIRNSSYDIFYHISQFCIQLQLYLSGQIKIEEINDNLDDYIECGAAAVDPHSGKTQNQTQNQTQNLTQNHF